MAVELDHHWQAEDEVLHLQSEMDQLSIQLQESNGKAQVLARNLKKAENEKHEIRVKFDSTKEEFQRDISELKTELESKLYELKSLAALEESNAELTDKLA